MKKQIKNLVAGDIMVVGQIWATVSEVAKDPDFNLFQIEFDEIKPIYSGMQFHGDVFVEVVQKSRLDPWTRHEYDPYCFFVSPVLVASSMIDDPVQRKGLADRIRRRILSE